ncbi:endothelial zinc finger protein induced by tumor necrosis factor alpha [Anastrepha obliqua]|uniref:endothelial zinc finger protein induced by tumor necrosis factor alpha n=1 Tax=Anastrepha obliqua TaxID=95512 RepID=UPI0024098E3E|nr:endothelial zinc finger protein induced by tumor necrosis factor alpha [Anastrepha obliqua]
MVDLETVVAPAEASAMNSATGLCRLCLRHDKTIVNIFEEELEPAAENAPLPEGAAKKMPMVERLFDLLGVKFQHSASLPSCICQRCFAMIEAFTNFRENVQRCETELQRWLEHNKKIVDSDDQRAGLNGNPGEFEPEVDCIITEVDPNQDYESSEDEFSMESDSETEEQLTSATHTMQTTPNAGSKLSQQQTNEFTDALTASIPITTGETQKFDTSLPVPETTPSGTPMPGSGDSFVTGEIVIKNTYLCQYCDMAFTTQSECQEHESQHDSAAPYVCSFCSQRTSSRQNLIYHIKELHDPERPYVCAFCKKGFCRRSDLKKHTIVHTGVRPFSCPVCAKSFSRNTNLTKHIRIHSSVKPHVCTRCPRSFSSASELMRHIRSHTNSKPFQCSRCPSTFARKDKLHLHERTHLRRDSEFLLNQSNSTPPSGNNKSEEGGGGVIGQTENIVVALNPYGEPESTQPPHANMSSPQDQYRQHSILAAQLQQRPVMPKPPPHKPSHPRNFTCTICQKSFTRERDLQRHQALHLDTLFTCKQCGIGFNRREKLARHELEFHAPQYPCDVCRIQFSKRDEYERHMKMHELQQNAVLATQAAISATSGIGGAPASNILGLAGGPNTAGAINLVTNASGVCPPPPPVPLPKDMSVSQHRPSAADMSFYSQLVPTMNLGFYSETRPEDRNGI